MTGGAAEDQQDYLVLVNNEEQFSIWPAAKDVPAGWRPVGPVGPKDRCIAYIEETWTDLRPLSLRRAMDGAGDEPASAG